jgi:predicted transposase YbfD/YdcC
MIHMVSAWASQNRLVLGQRKVSEKSNEITAIPELLRVLDLHGAVVSIDAMGCQTEIAAQIVEQQGDYVQDMAGKKFGATRSWAKQNI